MEGVVVEEASYPFADSGDCIAYLACFASLAAAVAKRHIVALDHCMAHYAVSGEVEEVGNWD